MAITERGEEGEIASEGRPVSELVFLQQLLVDYLGQTLVCDRDGLVHAELQSQYDERLTTRMLLYRATIVDRYATSKNGVSTVPDVDQAVLNLGRVAWPKERGICSPTLCHSFKVVDLCSISSRELFEGGSASDRVMSCLCRDGLVPRNLGRIIRAVDRIENREKRASRFGTADRMIGGRYAGGGHRRRTMSPVHFEGRLSSIPTSCGASASADMRFYFDIRRGDELIENPDGPESADLATVRENARRASANSWRKPCSRASRSMPSLGDLRRGSLAPRHRSVREGAVAELAGSRCRHPSHQLRWQFHADHGLTVEPTRLLWQSTSLALFASTRRLADHAA